MVEYRAAVIAYLQQVQDESGLSLNEIAQRVGVSHTTLTRPLNNPNYKYVPKYSTLQRIASVTGVHLPLQLTEAPAPTKTAPTLKLLSVRGYVAAGMWQSAEAIQDETLGETNVIEDPRYSDIPQWAEIVRGPSMNRTYLDGDFLHVVDFAELGRRQRPGDDVIVEQRNAQDGRVERTCKRVTMIGGQMSLVGDSTVEHWNEPLPIDVANGGVVQIIGLVIGSYRRRP